MLLDPSLTTPRLIGPATSTDFPVGSTIVNQDGLVLFVGQLVATPPDKIYFNMETGQQEFPDGVTLFTEQPLAKVSV